MGAPTESDNSIEIGKSAAAAVVRCYPDIHVAAHADGLDAAARLYLIARHLDKNGAGRLEAADLRTALEGRGLMTWRRIRQVLAAGAGIFWEHDPAGVIRLARPARILKSLKVGRLSFRAVNIPAAALFGSIADYRAAAVYGAVLAGRGKADAPISQAALRQATGGLSERAQRRYRKSAAVTAARSWRLSPADPTTLHNSLWEVARGRRGRIAYIHHDRRGLMGPPGLCYVATQQPNTYATTLERGRTGRRRKISRELRPPSLAKTERGNGRQRVFFANGGAAWRAWGRSGGAALCAYPVARPPDGRPAAYWTAAG